MWSNENFIGVRLGKTNFKGIKANKYHKMCLSFWLLCSNAVVKGRTVSILMGLLLTSLQTESEFAKKFAKPATNQSHSHQAAKVCCARIQPRKESMQLLGEKMNYRQWRRPSSRKWENISSNPLTILIKTPVKDLWLEFCNTPFLERPTGINLQHEWQAWLSLGSAFSTTTNHPVPT